MEPGPLLPAAEPDGQQVVVGAIGFATDEAATVDTRGCRVLVQPLGKARLEGAGLGLQSRRLSRLSGAPTAVLRMPTPRVPKNT